VECMPTLKAHLGFKRNLFKVIPDASEGVKSQKLLSLLNQDSV
jgi:hypothetical protein